jgi:hypothetical protein
MFVGFPTLEHVTYSCPCEKYGSQCCHAFRETFPRKDETGWEGRRRYINTGASDTDTHVTLRVGSTVLSSRQRNISLERQEWLRKWKNVLFVGRERKKDGRTLDRFYVIICINAMQLQVQFISHFLPVSSVCHFYTHAFRSLLRVFIAQPAVRVTSVTSHQHAPHHGYNAVAGQCGAGTHLLLTLQHPLPKK